MLTHSLKLRKPLAVIDLETTGVNVAKDKIVELCIAKAKLDGTVEVKTKLINPGIPIPLETSLIHGIYDDDVRVVRIVAEKREATEDSPQGVALLVLEGRV